LKQLRKRRIFLGLLLVIALMAFVACGRDDGTVLDPNTPNNVTDNNGTVRDDLNNAADNAGDAVRDTGDAVEDLVTTDGAVDKGTNNL